MAAVGSTASTTPISCTPAPMTSPTAAPALEKEEYSDDGFDSQDLKHNCNQIRAGIRQFLGTQEMTLKDFLTECRVNPGPYYRFMSLNGPDRGAGHHETPLEDGEYGHPPVFDDCDEIRQKISVFLGEKIVTQTAFLKALGSVSANSLRSFMGTRRGAFFGAANVVYRKAYAFFEKKRILEGGKKSNKRLDNEAKAGPDGFHLHPSNGKGYYVVVEPGRPIE